MALTPGETIRKRCVDCCGNQYTEVKSCDAGTMCPLHKYRLGKGRPSVKALRKFCLYCMCGSSENVKTCPQSDCVMYEYRFGTSPNREPMSDERKEKLVVALTRGREIYQQEVQQEIRRTRTRREPNGC